jgi:large subunit ribosomal protein L2
MLLIKKQKNTPGTRHSIQLAKFLLFKNNKIVKTLVENHKKQNGRSPSTGHITVWHRGGGCKNIYRKINFDNKTTFSIVLGIMYDSNRNNFISLNFDLVNKTFFNSNSILNTYAGSLLACQQKINDFYLGYRSKILYLPVGSLISNLSKGLNFSSLVRSAGTFAQLIQKTTNSCKIRLPSNQVIVLPSNSYATIGINANIQSNRVVIGKAGKNRFKNIRPTVRGIAMNPVDHPHGGRSNGGGHPVTPWGIKTRGKKTKKKLK